MLINILSWSVGRLRSTLGVLTCGINNDDDENVAVLLLLMEVQSLSFGE